MAPAAELPAAGEMVMDESVAGVLCVVVGVTVAGLPPLPPLHAARRPTNERRKPARNDTRIMGIPFPYDAASQLHRPLTLVLI
jgi:hypothetical protein